MPVLVIRLDPRPLDPQRFGFILKSLVMGVATCMIGLLSASANASDTQLQLPICPSFLSLSIIPSHSYSTVNTAKYTCKRTGDFPLTAKMEIVSSAASVIAVIQLAGSVVKSCGGYIKQVKDAQKEILSLQQELGDLLKVLEKLSELLQSTQDTTLSTSETVRDELLKCHTVLEALKGKIDPGNGKKAMSRMVFRALKWPLTSTEAERAKEDLERCKLSLNLDLQIYQT